MVLFLVVPICNITKTISNQFFLVLSLSLFFFLTNTLNCTRRKAANGRVWQLIELFFQKKKSQLNQIIDKSPSGDTEFIAQRGFLELQNSKWWNPNCNTRLDCWMLGLRFFSYKLSEFWIRKKNVSRRCSLVPSSSRGRKLVRLMEMEKELPSPWLRAYLPEHRFE